ncbi:hypothetical protein ACWGH8_11765 [Nonomuraea muscovyensis]|uniref:Uncharacterized protein n=1 Tax=Nonomuraea muscovyensis TaxID=1124761 RepID=A0A7X0CAL5_9ACTN|nr:hypothetical protein [Nonomuraea muscovyensis]MBB6350656.1 hypothetical protein [Nonomuraea muscovyensis]
MGGVALSQKALQRLQESVHDRSVDLVKLKDGKPAAKATPEFGAAFPVKQEARVFGELADSDALITALNSVEQRVSDQVTAAKDRLDDVERALDQIRRNMQKADKGSTVQGDS